jgi:hypothetical protein
MSAGSHGGGQTNVAGDDQQQAACPADAGNVAAQRRAIGMIVVPEHDPGAAARQTRDGFSWVG